LSIFCVLHRTSSHIVFSLAILRATPRCYGPRQLKNWNQLVGVVRRRSGLGRQGMAKFVVVGPHIMSNARQSGLVARNARQAPRLPCSYIVAPIFHGSNSSSPMPSASDFVFWPEAVFTMSSNIRLPLSWIDSSPSTMVPQLMSMSSVMRR